MWPIIRVVGDVEGDRPRLRVRLEPGTRLGQYEILGQLGRGGMATVYRAYQPTLEREVALKVLPEDLVGQPGFKARFHREAVAVARLKHPNILSVYDHGEQDGVTYIVSELVEGGTLAERLGAPIQLEYCIRILRPIADALDYAHGEGVVHRDVKPSNILLDRRGAPILADFGLARVAENAGDERLTQTGALLGTPTYMAPEQCTGREAGPPADVYALAVIAFEMITGRVPFSAPTPLGVIAAHQVTPPPSPREFIPSLPENIVRPLLAGLAKEPARRPETATDFVDGIQAAVPIAPSYPSVVPVPPGPISLPNADARSSGPYDFPQPAVAPPPPPGYGSISRTRRRWLIPVAAAVLVVALVGTGLGVAAMSGLLKSRGPSGAALGSPAAETTPGATSPSPLVFVGPVYVSDISQLSGDQPTVKGLVTIGATPYQHGLQYELTQGQTVAVSFAVPSGAQWFWTAIGIDAVQRQSTYGQFATLTFDVFVDGQRKAELQVHPKSAAQTIEVDVKGKSTVKLAISEPLGVIDYPRADWGDPQLRSTA